MSTVDTQLSWLRDRVGVYPSSDRWVYVRGDDARAWLNGQISNDVRALGAGEARYALVLTAKGRIVSDLWAIEEPPGMALALPGAHLDTALERLDKHIIMEDVELALARERALITVQGPLASELIAVLPDAARHYTCARLGTSGFDAWLLQSEAAAALERLARRAAELGGGVVDQAGWAAAHVAFGIPRLGVDFGEDSYPQEAGIGARALSFSKGCYLGQEVTYMLEHRGQLARRLAQLEAGPSLAFEPGAHVLDAEGKRIGEITSLAHTAGATLALAYLKRAFAEPERPVWVAGSPCQVRRVIA